MRRYELTDEQWEVIADLFPEQTMGRSCRCARTVLNGILWILCSGAAWRDLPERYGPWKTIYHRFRQWKATRRFDHILERLHVELDERDLIDYATWMIDSPSVRASRVAAGAPTKKGAGLSDQALGRSRCGLTPKIHISCDGGDVPLAACRSVGQRHDTPHLMPLMETVRVPRRRPGRPRTRPETLIADRGYDAAHVRHYLRRRGIRAMIPKRKPGKGRQRRRRGRPPIFDETLYAQRNVIERLIGGLKECRRLASRYDTYARCYLAMVKLDFIRRCFRRIDVSDTA